MRTLVIILRMSVFAESNSPLKINVLILPDTSMMCLAAILEPMRAVNRIADQNLFDWRITTLNGGSINLSCGIAICADEKFSSNLNGDLLLLRAGLNHSQHIGKNDLKQIRQASHNHAATGGIEAGAWLLAHIGLLNNRPATTHWEDLDEPMTIDDLASRLNISRRKLENTGNLFPRAAHQERLQDDRQYLSRD